MDGVLPQEQLDAVGVRARRLMARAYGLLFGTLLPALSGHGIRLLRLDEVTDEEREWLAGYYREHVHPVLTPLAAGPGHPFPHVRNLRPALGAVMREPASGLEHFVVLELPGGIPRFVTLPDGRSFVPVEEVIRGHLGELYPGMKTIAAHTFRVTRSAELLLDTAHLSDVLQAVEEEVRRRPFRPVVRLEVEDGMPAEMRSFLLRELRYEEPGTASGLSEDDVYAVPWLVDLRGLREVAALPGEGLHYPPFEARSPVEPGRPLFDVLREREVLVHFPYDSFEDTVERFLLEAADDPDVVAIKLALYRTDKSSRIVEALRRASARGKQVVALVELTARFDEQRNIEWARYLRAAGIHVIYGLPGLKCHAKVALVVRREAEGVRRYLYVGTGNLNAATATAYTDLGLLSADPELGEDLNDLFNVLTGYAPARGYRRILAAPHTMRRRFVELVEREAEHAREGRGGEIRAKFNGLADREMIAALYRASQAGVRVDLVVRGLCALRPGVPGLSDNIRVVSVLGRFLEHGRIFRFANAGEPEYFIGSADWRTRNLSHRVEVATPVRDPAHRARLDRILEEQLTRPDAWELGSDGTYYRRPEVAPHAPERPAGDQGRLIFATGSGSGPEG
jgi:polyphosphate kinase